MLVTHYYNNQQKRKESLLHEPGGSRNEQVLINLTQAIHLMFENQSYKNTHDP